MHRFGAAFTNTNGKMIMIAFPSVATKFPNNATFLKI